MSLAASRLELIQRPRLAINNIDRKFSNFNFAAMDAHVIVIIEASDVHLF
jgi:hypothetical protein